MVHSFRFAVGLGVACLSAGSTSAATIGINFVTATENHTLAPTDVTGAVAASNWNNVTVAKSTDPLNDVLGTFSGTLVDGNGDATSVGVNWRAGQIAEKTVTNPNPTNGIDYKLMGSTFWGDKTGGDGGKNEYFELTGLASLLGGGVTSYDVYFYFGGGGGTGYYKISLDGVAKPNTQTMTGTYAGAFIEDDGTVAGNYVVLRDLSANTIRSTIFQSGGGEFGISGVQIVYVPEPASFTLLGIGTLTALRRRRA